MKMDNKDSNECFFVITNLRPQSTCFGIVAGYLFLEGSKNWIWEVTVIEGQFPVECVFLGCTNPMAL